jgi:hypothetical protein
VSQERRNWPARRTGALIVGGLAPAAAGGDVTGTLAVTLGNDTLAAAGTVTNRGTLAQTLADATSAATGTVRVSGTVSQTLGAATLAASGLVVVSGTLSRTLDATTSAASGIVTNRGTLAVTLADATLAASGTLGISGSLSQTLANATATISGTVTVSGTLSQTLGDATLASSGSVGGAVAGTLAVTLAAATSAASGTVTNRGTLAVTLADATLAASGSVLTPVTGTLAVTLEAATLAASGTAGAPAVRPPIAHNGGKLQINIGAGAIPFLNYAKMMHPWTNVSGNVWADPSELTAKGYPKSAGAKVWYTSVDVPRQSARAGNYVIKWTGTATFGWSLNTSTLVSADPGVTVTGSGAAQTYAGTNGRIVVTPAVATGTGGVEVGRITLRVISTSDLSDLVVCHTDDEARLAAGEIFQQIGLDVLRAGNFGVIRLMDSFWTNVTNVSRWSDRKPLDYFSWREHEFREALWAGTTTNSGNAFSAALAGYALEHGRLTLLRWNAAPTSGVDFTLNIGGTGAKPVVTRTGAVVSGGLMPVLNGMSSVVYDADMDWYVLAEGNSTNPYWGIQNGWPPEVAVELCNLVRARPWVTMPYLCEKDPSDYMGGWAQLFNASLGSGLVPILQNVNEMWNSGSSWPGTLYFDAKAKAIYGPSYNYLDWYSRSLSLMGQAISAVFGGDRSKYWTVVGQHTQDPFGTTAAARRLESTAYVALEGGSPAKNWITHAAMTNYWAAWYHNLKGSTEELVYAWEWKDALAARKTELIDQYVSENQSVNTNGPYGQVTVARLKVIVALWVGRYGAYDLPIIHYEGGYSPDFAVTNARSAIVGITKGAQTVITLSASDNQAVPVVGMSCLIEAGTVVGMTELNGNTYTVTAINVAARQFTLNVDSTGFGDYTSGGVAQYLDTKTPLNDFRRASKYSDHVRTLTLRNYADIEAVGALMPSEFTLTGPDAWGIADPDLYADPYTARWNAILEFGTPPVIRGRPHGDLASLYAPDTRRVNDYIAAAVIADLHRRIHALA